MDTSRQSSRDKKKWHRIPSRTEVFQLDAADRALVKLLNPLYLIISRKYAHCTHLTTTTKLKLIGNLNDIMVVFLINRVIFLLRNIAVALKHQTNNSGERFIALWISDSVINRTIVVNAYMHWRTIRILNASCVECTKIDRARRNRNILHDSNSHKSNVALK